MAESSRALHRINLMYRRLIAIVLLASAPISTRADDGFEDLLIKKFQAQRVADYKQLEAAVDDAKLQAEKLKDTDPDRGIEILRDIRNRMDNVKLISMTERRAQLEKLQPVVAELPDLSLRKRREKASMRLDAF